MGQRLQLQALLETLGASKVYFQEPSQDKMVYPCILYSKDDEAIVHADNKLHIRTIKYQVTVIDRNPDSEIPGRVAHLPLTSFSRLFVVDGLYHNIYDLYF